MWSSGWASGSWRGWRSTRAATSVCARSTPRTCFLRRPRASGSSAAPTCGASPTISSSCSRPRLRMTWSRRRSPGPQARHTSFDFSRYSVPVKWIFRLAAAVLVLALLCVAAAYAYLRLSLPKVEGEIKLAGLSAPIEVQRDRYGIPHISAQTLEDAVYGLGFVHAQDRLWQMEMNRRIAAGRMAEILGPGALETDRFLRTLGVHRAAQANLRQLDPETRRLLDAYAAGVNAFLATGPVLPIEFWLTGARPEPWTPLDSAAWIKMMAWDLGGNWR